MSVKKIIDYDVPTVLPTETGDSAIRIMEDHNIGELPVVADDHYMALLKMEELLDWDTPEKPVAEADFLKYSPAVQTESHAFEALRLAYNQKIGVIPVVDSDNKYYGSGTSATLLNYLAEYSGIDSPGSVLVLEVNPLDYSLYNIARIAESEEVSIITTQLYTNRATNKLELTMKTNRNNLESLAATYERFGYTVKELYGERSNKDDMMDRYNLLMTWLNI